MTRAFAVAGILFCTAPALAWDAASTHAGLTEGAVLQSRLGKILTASYGKPLGLFEPLTLALDGERGERVTSRLAKLDAAGGYAPDHGRLAALSWVVAGSVAEEVPAERDRNHFFDPTTGRGLEQGGFLAGAGVRLAGVSDGSGSLRGFFSGASFDGTGRASTSWLTDEQNDFSLTRFLDARARATAGKTREERERALADALLTAGALLHVVEDAADPAHVRNDYRVAMAENGARLRRFAAWRYGRLGVPAPSGPADPLEHLTDAIHTAGGTGLADRTARRFFSDGTLPGTGLPLPTAIPGPAQRGYVAAEGVPHLVAWIRDGNDVQWELDQRCLADYAAALLPDAGRGALSALEHLFRGELAVTDGQVVNGPVPLGAGKVRLFAEDDKGNRHPVYEHAVATAAADEKLFELPADALAQATRIALLFQGVDSHGEPIVIAIESARKSND
jgi:hypothetical protein